MSRPDPTIPYDHFHHALIEQIAWPHPDRLILTLAPLIWVGGHGMHAALVELHFYAVQQHHTVASFLTQCIGEDIASLGFDPNKHSTYQLCYTMLVLERRNQEITIQSHDLIIFPKPSRSADRTIDGEVVVYWLAQELHVVFAASKQQQYRRLHVLFQQLAEYTPQLSRHDKTMLMNRILGWRETNRIENFPIASDDRTLHLLNDIIGTLDGLLAEEV